jgi:hypothetical protein
MVPDNPLVLRVMPDDNSCMCKCYFCTTLQCGSTDSNPSQVTAFGGALGLENPSITLRNKVADYILSHPNEYNEAILGDKPARYTTRMRQMDTWGGAIELSILSDIYDIEISSIDVKVSPRFSNPVEAGLLTVPSPSVSTALAKAKSTALSSCTRAFTTTG